MVDHTIVHYSGEWVFYQGAVAAGALLVVLVWAAIERGRIHHMAALHPGLREDAAALLACAFDWRRHTVVQ